MGYRTLTAANGKEALRTFDLHQSRIAAVLTDVVMPRMGGKDLYEALRQRGVPVPVLFMSGYPLGDEPVPSGIAAYLEKPLKADDVLRAVTGAIGNRRPIRRGEQPGHAPEDRTAVSSEPFVA